MYTMNKILFLFNNDNIFVILLDFFQFLSIIIYTYKSHGLVRVSTGILRYDKRGGLDNPVIMSNLKNKRQQFCSSCSVSCDAAKSAARTA